MTQIKNEEDDPQAATLPSTSDFKHRKYPLLTGSQAFRRKPPQTEPSNVSKKIVESVKSSKRYKKKNVNHTN